MVKGGWCPCCGSRIVNNFKRHVHRCVKNMEPSKKRRNASEPDPIILKSLPFAIGAQKPDELRAEKHINVKYIKTTKLEKFVPDRPRSPGPPGASILDMMKYGVRQARVSHKMKNLAL